MTSLLERLRDPEDQFVERKPAAAGKSDFKRSLVAFANSVPQNRTGILFVGVSDKGEVLGVEDSDRTQKDLRRLAENECYPPIFIDLEVLTVAGKVVVAAQVTSSSERPHFAGGAFVRRGSESVAATEQEYEQLIASRHSLVRELQDWIGKTITVTEVKKRLGEYAYIPGDHVATDEYQVAAVTPHFIRLLLPRTGQYVSETIECFRLSWDDKKHRPRLLVFPFPSSAP